MKEGVLSIRILTKKINTVYVYIGRLYNLWYILGNVLINLNILSYAFSIIKNYR